MFVSGRASSSPGTAGMTARMPTSMNTRSPTSICFPPSFSRTSSVFGPTNCPGAHDQLGTAVLVVPQIHGDLVVDRLALPVTDLRHVDRDTPGIRAVIRAAAHQ